MVKWYNTVYISVPHIGGCVRGVGDFPHTDPRKVGLNENENYRMNLKRVRVPTPTRLNRK